MSSTFSAPPMPLDQWRALVDFDRQVKAQTNCSFLDHSTLQYIHEFSQRSREPVQKTIPGVIVGAADDPLLLKNKTEEVDISDSKEDSEKSE
jgi:hypothetical protein